MEIKDFAKLDAAGKGVQMFLTGLIAGLEACVQSNKPKQPNQEGAKQC